MRITFTLLALALTACARPVDVSGSPADPACTPFLASLPVTVVGERMRETVPRDATAAAWGDPPIVVRCGVNSPAALESTSGLIDVESITWFPEPLSNGTLFTTVGRTPRIEVTVPRDFAPEVNVLVDLAGSTRTHTDTS